MVNVILHQGIVDFSKVRFPLGVADGGQLATGVDGDNHDTGQDGDDADHQEDFQEGEAAFGIRVWGHRKNKLN